MANDEDGPGCARSNFRHDSLYLGLRLLFMVAGGTTFAVFGFDHAVPTWNLLWSAPLTILAVVAMWRIGW